ncbi:MAG TPA: methenyltetrahydromethanopterin cyclohydrolase [Gemmataceae bacterium]|nr:methenyltetrahydromethanopterin cyclohydrolase [Gemmataceae bacterium]
MSSPMPLNERALRLADHMAATAAALRIAVSNTPNGARVLDCGVNVEGGLQAGLAMARVCLAGQAEVTLVPGSFEDMPVPLVQVHSDHPVLACMASQYAGWQVSVGKFFGMGSGPMRAAYGKEELFEQIPGREQASAAVGVLETNKLPSDEVTAYLAERLNLPPNKLTLIAAPASSQAGNVQVVARSLETALHKLFELQFDLGQIVSGYGTAPLPPVAADFLGAIGRTNDAILYGGQVVLWVRTDDEQIAEIGPKVPSSSSPDHGAPFAEIFERYERDFYRIDPLLFSPAVIVFQNLRTGKSHVFGRVERAILRRSFGLA